MIRIIANPLAGGGRAVGEASSLARACADAGIPTHVHVASDRLDTIRAAREGAVRGLVVACGGDGTVHDCLQGVMGEDQPSPRLAIWPVGTGNDIVRSLDFPPMPDREGHGPLMTERFIGAFTSQSFLGVDVGMVKCDSDDVEGDVEGEGSKPGTYFLGVLSCGFDSDVNERANSMPAKVGRARYLLGVARELPALRPRWYAIDSDGNDTSMAGMIVAVGNGRAYGSGMLICPDADMSDGKFDITLVTDTPKRTFVSVLPKVYSGRHVEHPSVVSWRAEQIRISAPDSLVYADGERIGPLPARISMLAGALEVLDLRDGG